MSGKIYLDEGQELKLFLIFWSRNRISVTDMKNKDLIITENITNLKICIYWWQTVYIVPYPFLNWKIRNFIVFSYFRRVSQTMITTCFMKFGNNSILMEPSTSSMANSLISWMSWSLRSRSTSPTSTRSSPWTSPSVVATSATVSMFSTPWRRTSSPGKETPWRRRRSLVRSRLKLTGQAMTRYLAHCGGRGRSIVRGWFKLFGGEIINTTRLEQISPGVFLRFPTHLPCYIGAWRQATETMVVGWTETEMEHIRVTWLDNSLRYSIRQEWLELPCWALTPWYYLDLSDLCHHLLHHLHHQWYYHEWCGYLGQELAGPTVGCD